MDQPDKAANLARGKLNRAIIIISLSPFAPKNLVPGAGSAVSSRVSLLFLHIHAESVIVLNTEYSTNVSFADCYSLNRVVGWMPRVRRSSQLTTLQ